MSDFMRPNKLNWKSLLDGAKKRLVIISNQAKEVASFISHEIYESPRNFQTWKKHKNSLAQMKTNAEFITRMHENDPDWEVNQSGYKFAGYFKSQEFSTPKPQNLELVDQFLPNDEEKKVS